MRTPRRLAFILAISIGLNLFLGGVIASHLFWRGDHWRMGAPGAEKISRHIFHRRAAAATLNDDHRHMANEIWHQSRQGHRSHFRAMRQSRQEIRQILIADDFDPKALTVAYEKLNQQITTARSGLGGAIAEIAEKLPTEARKRYFDAGFRRPDRGGFHHPPHRE
ncbi:MAG: putative membrane protein [Alphaproteobacteria bacterium]|jgi:uncharacterized membrane protein